MAARTFEIWRIETTYLSPTPLRVSVLRNVEMLSQGHQNLDVFQRAGDMGQAQQTGQHGMNHGHKVWDAATGEVERTLAGHSDWVSAVAFSPDRRRIASGSDDETANIHEPNSTCGQTSCP